MSVMSKRNFADVYYKICFKRHDKLFMHRHNMVMPTKVKKGEL